MTMSTPTRRAGDAFHLAEVLRKLFVEQRALLPDDPYLIHHSEPNFLAGTINVFDWYRPHLPGGGRLLDWGCRHAADSCLIRTVYGTPFEYHACDLPAEGHYRVFHEYAGLNYQQLTDVVELPYESGSFDAVIGSAVLEHVAMDYESLKEIYRVLKPGGRLIITYLPNRRSATEWYLRRFGKPCAHRRLYTHDLIRELLLRTGFYPLQSGYQSKFDQLKARNATDRILRPGVRLFQAHRFIAACLCAVATKMECM